MKNSLFKKAIRMLTNNIGLKLLAVIVSCGLWFVVNNITDPIKPKNFNNIPVEFINVDAVTNEGKVYEVLDGTNLVNVTVTGKSSVISNISREDIRAVADMSELTFMNTVRITVSSVRNNSELDFKTSIENVKLSIETKTSIQKPILASTIGSPAEGYVVGKVETSENVVRFSGPESIIQLIDHVDAVTNVEGSSSDINTSVDLKLYDVEGKEIKNNSIKMNISKVNVSVTILATKDVPLSFVVAGEPARGYVVSEGIVSVPETVKIAGRTSALDSISKISIADAALTVEGAQEPVTVVLNIKKYLPSNVQFANSNFSGNVSVTVGIEQLVTRELQIPARNFAAGSKPEQLNLTLKEVETQDYYTIRISGTRVAVDAVNVESTIGVVDMEALLEKLGFAEWVAGVYQGEITFNLPDNVTLQQPYLMTIVLEEIVEDTGDEGAEGGEENNNAENE
ncbi:MAG: CdaR family protein [Lachnospiraceae bacterium]|jgi:hypothetical protein|nr:CdaR family protein [Lachnospiraceae bacterium]HBV81838.1 hypothetical protein [Lachnospiraceae bacterium]